MGKWKYLFFVLFLIVAAVWIAVLVLPDKNLHLITCDVGQGDAILAVYGNIQILTDGGPPNNKVLDCINRHVPFWDREIEVIMLTHSQQDHFGGLIEVFKRFKVDNFVANGLDSSSSTYKVLKNTVGGSGARIVTPISGLTISIGMMHLDTFWPSEEFLKSEGWDGTRGKLGTFTSSKDANNFSLQAILSFGEFNALLTGDIGHNMAGKVISQFSLSKAKDVEYIKVSHHGSKSGMTADYLNVINPEVAVISVGQNNSYGLPDDEILNLLKDKGIKTLRTDEVGDIEIVTDGKKWWIR